jgi:hypothetical protein
LLLCLLPLPFQLLLAALLLLLLVGCWLLLLSALMVLWLALLFLLTNTADCPTNTSNQMRIYGQNEENGLHARDHVGPPACS